MMEKYMFPSKPLANTGAVIRGPTYRFTLLTSRVLRYEWAADGIFEDRASTFAINRHFPVPEYYVRDDTTGPDGKLEIVTPTFQVSYNKQRFSANGFSVSFNSKVTAWGADWLYGSGPSMHNLGGTARTLDKIDGRCDMGAGVLSKEGHAVVDDTGSMLFDGNGFVTPRLEGDRIDGYLFVYGHDFKGAMKDFYAISGPQPTLPRWSLGNWWSRFNKYTSDSYLKLMDRFRDEGVPLSVAVIDMDWHLVDDERVPHAGWTGYTWDKKLFPDPAAFAQALHDRNFKITLNDHPHGGVHHHEDDYEELARAINHDTSKKLPILFDPTAPSFLDAYLDVLHRNLEKQGCDFWWIDWQQGPISRVPGLDPLWLLNHFHFLDNGIYSPSGSLPLILSRYAGPGSHRYPVGFSGDSIISWDSLAFQPEFTATASNIGYGWWSHDLGGHMHGTRDDELTARWVQFGALSPILRLHSSNSPWAGKEPWNYGREAGDSMKESLRLRHRLVPYLYSESCKQDEPLCQPMYWSYSARNEAYEYPNQYTFGGSLVAAPIVQPRDLGTGQAHVKVWVPPGRHVDVHTGAVYDGDRELDMYRPLESLPLLAPEGSIIPFDGDAIPANGCSNPESFDVLIVVGKDGHYAIIEDDRDDSQDASGNRRRVFDLQWDQISGCLSVQATSVRHWSFRFISVLQVPSNASVSINGSPVLKAGIKVSKPAANKPSSLVVSLPGAVDADSTITVNLGPNPQLSIADHMPIISGLITQYQIEYGIKDKIWNVLKSNQATGVKVGRLMGLGLEKDVLGPLMELLVADSRVKKELKEKSVPKTNGVLVADHEVNGVDRVHANGVDGTNGVAH
jgi:alpha-glucosidase (family GH31 glycosyl hydrolase)